MDDTSHLSQLGSSLLSISQSINPHAHPIISLTYRSEGTCTSDIQVSYSGLPQPPEGATAASALPPGGGHVNDRIAPPPGFSEHLDMEAESGSGQTEESNNGQVSEKEAESSDRLNSGSGAEPNDRQSDGNEAGSSNVPDDTQEAESSNIQISKPKLETDDGQISEAESNNEQTDNRKANLFNMPSDPVLSGSAGASSFSRESDAPLESSSVKPKRPLSAACEKMSMIHVSNDDDDLEDMVVDNEEPCDNRVKEDETAMDISRDNKPVSEDTTVQESAATGVSVEEPHDEQTTAGEQHVEEEQTIRRRG